MSKWNQRLLSAVAVLLLLLALVYVGKGAVAYTAAGGMGEDDAGRYPADRAEFCVVIDAGHGGVDPGKIGINGAQEKDINLLIAEKVKKYLEANDVRVVMTREGDDGLYDPGASNRKVQDMKRRIAIIDETAPQITVSIHQNSYPEEYVHGAQVFFYTGSREGQELAEMIQRQLVDKVDPENKRQVKANDSYYLLKKTETPIVIVECGFLSNSEEAEKLCDDEYQEEIAWAIHMGILQYLNTQD